MNMKQSARHRAQHFEQLSLLPWICPLCSGTKLIPHTIRDVRRKSGFRRQFVKCIRCN